jgi:hypothetical protein
MLNVADRVRFNHHTRPQYLRGVEGVVIELGEHTAQCACAGQLAASARARHASGLHCYSSG